MKRNIVLTMMALIIAVMGVRPVNAQDISFSAANRNVPGIGNRGVTAASVVTGLLNTNVNDGAGIQANSFATFNCQDVAAGDFNADGRMDIVGVDVNNTGTLTLLVGLGDGSFGCPLSFLLTSFDGVALSAADLDLDGITDLAIAEQGVTGGIPGVEVITGFFLSTGLGTSLDVFVPTDPTAGFPVAVSFGRLNDDPLADIAVALGTDTTGAFQTINTSGGTYLPADPAILTVGGITGGPFGSPLGIPSPRAIFIQQSNVCNTTVVPSTPADADLDIFVATTSAIGAGNVEVYENQGLGLFTPFTGTVPGTDAANNAVLKAGSAPVGVLVLDLNADNRNDIAALNRGSGTVSTFLAAVPNAVDTLGCGYAVPTQALAGANPVSLTTMNFNNDGRLDLAIANSAVGTAGFGSVQVLTGNGSGAFQPAARFDINTAGITNPQSVTVGRFDSSSQTDDIVVAEGTGPTPGGIIYLDAGAGYARNFLQLFTATSLTADFDGAGGLNDVAVVEQAFGFVFVLLNVNAANFNVGVLVVQDLFTAFTVVPTSATAFRDALTGLSDLAITDIGTPTGNSGFGQIIVGLNDGTGNFLDIFQFRQFVATPGATNLLNNDFNNDGIDDLAYIDFGSNFAAVALNDGTNFFLTPQFRETGGFEPVSAALGDVNDDDNLDIVVINQGNAISFNQSIVSVLFGQGDGRLVPTGALLQVPNFGISMVGGLADIEANGVRRVVDFNNDGFPDFAVASTQGGTTRPTNPTVTLLLNRPDSPGSFNVQLPVELIDNLNNTNLTLADTNVVGDQRNVGGPALVSGRGGTIGTGIGLGGANYTMAVGDFNADGSPDLTVTGTRILGASSAIPGLIPGTNFRSTIYLIGDNTDGSMRVSRPQRTNNYTRFGVPDFQIDGCDTFVATSTGEFSRLANRVPDVFHLSINGNIWVDQNTSSILNHNPILTIRRADLNAPFPGGGRKVFVTAGQTASIPVTGFDADGDKLAFSLVSPPGGQAAPSFVTLKDNGNNTATVTVNSGDINRGPGNAIFRIAVEATDTSASGPGGRLPLTGRAFFTLVVRPNTPPTIGAVANQTLEAGKTVSLNLNVTDVNGNKVTTTVRCDKGNFVTASGTTLTIAPQSGDVGTTSCTITATDEFGLSSTTTFVVTVNAANVAPTLATIADQTVKAGASTTVNITASDGNGTAGLRLSIVSAPAFVSLSDNGNGTGVLRIAPSLTDTQGGRVTVQVTDPGGLSAQTSFNVTVQKAVSITAASFAKQSSGSNLFISGLGFGSSGATVSVNGTNVSARIIGQSDTSITLKGNKKKLNLKNGPNTITVTAGGVASNPFVLNLLAGDEE